MKSRSIKKATATEISRMSQSIKYLECANGCGREYPASGDAKSIICPYCVQKLVAPPAGIKTPTKDIEEKPKGWQLRKEYISPSGKVYHRGILDELNSSNGSGAAGSKKGAAKITADAPNTVKRKRGRPRKNI